MRRIMADILADGSMLTQRPDEDHKTLKIPEPASGNVANVGFFGYGDYINTHQEMEIKIIRSGGFTNYPEVEVSNLQCPQYGSFGFQLDFLKDGDGASANEITDDNNLVGGEYDYCPHHAWCLNQSATTLLYGTPKITALHNQKWTDVRRTAICTYGYRNTVAGTASVVVKANKIGDMSTYNNGDWGSVTISGAPSSVTATVMMNSDICEMADGTLYMAVFHEQHFSVYRSIDSGTTWVYCGQKYIHAGGATATEISIECIGERLVVIFSYGAGGGNIYIKSSVSNDYGMTWSSLTTIINGSVSNGTAYIDTMLGADGRIYLSYFVDDGGGTDEIRMKTSLDGQSWASYFNPHTSPSVYDSFTACQMYYGGWLSFGIVSATGEIGRRAYEEIRGSATNGGAMKYLTLGSTDADSDYLTLCSREIARGQCVDTAILCMDTVGNYNAVIVVRSYMWSGIQPAENGNDSCFDVCWFPWAYPSTSDPHPDLNLFSRQQDVGCTSTLTATSNKLSLVTNLVADDMYYYLSGGLPANMRDNGCVLRFQLKVVSGEAKVNLYLENAGGRSTISVIFKQSTNEIIVYDIDAASEIDSVTPTNWSVDEYQDYVIAAIGDDVYVYRAPMNNYIEIAPFELVVDGTVTPVAVVGSQWIYWGIISVPAAHQVVSEVEFRSMMINYTDDGGVSNWDFATNVIGKHVAYDACGLFQGIYGAFDGKYVIADDQWSFDVGAVYEAENIFIPSPSVKWMEPDQGTSASPDSVFKWRIPEVNSKDRRFQFDGLAVFNRNWLNCKLEGSLNDSSWTTLFDSNATEKTWIKDWNVAAVADNRIYITKHAGELDMIPNQYASTPDRQYYVYVYSGAAGVVDRTYKIIANTAELLIVEEAPDGLAMNDDIYVFSDRFFYQFSALKEYEYLKFTIYGSHQPWDSDDRLWMGTLVVGRVYDLSNDEWASNVEYSPSTSVIKGRGGLSNVKTIGKMLRTINLSYTGEIDRGMFVTNISKLAEHLRWGVHPLVWLDDDSCLDHASDLVHHDPILARLGGLSQSRVAYYPMNEYQTNETIQFIRNILDTGQVSLEEVV